MPRTLSSHLLASVTGGVIVAASFVALGAVGRRTSQTVVYETMEPGVALSMKGHGVSAHDIYVRDAPSVVLVRAAGSGAAPGAAGVTSAQSHASVASGSGFLIRTTGGSGFILTTDDVIAGADPRTGVTIQFDDGGARPATVVGADASDDLALLKVGMGGMAPLRALPVGDSSHVKVGDPTLVITDPFGSDRALAGGIVSALQSQIEAASGFVIDNVIETDAPALPGESGAPLLDGGGHVIGIDAQMAARAATGAGTVEVPFAVPIDTVKQFLASAGRTRETAVASLGVSSGRNGAVAVQPAVPAAAGGALAAGVDVAVAPGGPAAQAGLRTHDSIEAIDGHRVRAIAELDAIVAARKPGTTVSITVWRGHRLRDVKVVLGRRLVRATAASRMYT